MEPSQVMQYGSYFAQLAIGSGATDEVVGEDDLPKNKNGTKTANR